MKFVMLVAFLASLIHGYRALSLTGTKWSRMDFIERMLLAMESPQDYITVVALPIAFLTLSFVPASVLIPVTLLIYSIFGIYKSYEK